MGTQWINSLYPVFIMLTVWPFVWGISFKTKLTLAKYLEILKNRRWFFVINVVLGTLFMVLVMINKEKFLWYVGIVTTTNFRPYDNYYPTLALCLFMILGGLVGSVMSWVKYLGED